MSQKQQTTEGDAANDKIVSDNTTAEVISETEGVSSGSSSSHEDSAYSPSISNDVSSWAGRVLTPKERDLVTLMGPHINPEEFPRDSNNRPFPVSILNKKFPNGEYCARDWLVWSEPTASLFCFSCCLFNDTVETSPNSSFANPSKGINTGWRKLYEKCKQHEDNSHHIKCYFRWKELMVSLKKQSGVDKLIEAGLIAEENRWKSILKCAVDVTLYLSQ